jgi:hypothetical protein
MRSIAAAVAIFALLLAVGCESRPVRYITPEDLYEMATVEVTLQYMGSDGLYHYIDQPTPAGHASYRTPRSGLTLKRTFPVGGDARYPLDANTIHSGLATSTEQAP